MVRLACGGGREEEMKEEEVEEMEDIKERREKMGMGMGIP